MHLSPRNPAEDSRVRYSQHFQSNIFVPDDSRKPRVHPAGKRRDQTTGELFGGYNDKDLRAMPKTFVPADDAYTARQKKQNFLSSDVLPRSVYPADAHPPLPPQPRIQDAMLPHDTEEVIDPVMRRQAELSSDHFGRATPQVTPAEAHDKTKRLTPSDFKWHSHPEAVGQGTLNGDGLRHQDRSYKEKCSNVFDHSSPEGKHQEFAQSRNMDKASCETQDRVKRANAHFSDVFNQGSHGEGLKAPLEEGGRRHKPRGSDEHRVVIHQDWTDSKTEIMHGSRKHKDANPAQRRADEVHSSQVFPEVTSYMPTGQPLTPMSYDNAHKVRHTGQKPMDMHQAHLQSSHMADGFYEDASQCKHWEVVELHISGLPLDAENVGMKALCRCGNIQVVKVNVEMDPVRNLCKGRARVMVRYNPVRDKIGTLVQQLEAKGLSVEV